MVHQRARSASRPSSSVSRASRPQTADWLWPSSDDRTIGATPSSRSPTSGFGIDREPRLAFLRSTLSPCRSWCSSTCSPCECASSSSMATIVCRSDSSNGCPASCHSAGRWSIHCSASVSRVRKGAPAGFHRRAGARSTRRVPRRDRSPTDAFRGCTVRRAARGALRRARAAVPRRRRSTVRARRLRTCSRGAGTGSSARPVCRRVASPAARATRSRRGTPVLRAVATARCTRRALRSTSTTARRQSTD